MAPLNMFGKRVAGLREAPGYAVDRMFLRELGC